MSIRPPRRIFSGPTAPRRNVGVTGHTLAAGLVGVIAGAFIVLMAVPAELFGRVPAPSGVVAADSARVAVVNGDTLRLDETVLRLQGVAAPPRGRVCRRAEGTEFDCGAAAAAALADLVRGRRVLCRITGRDGFGVVEAQCEAGELDLNRRLVAEGFARARADAPVYGAEEQRARTEARGLWKSGLTF